MSIKRTVLAVISGVALEVGAVWAANRFMGWRLERVNWHSIYVWLFFFSGFFSAVWLYIWSKLIGRLFGGKKKGMPAAAVVSSQPQSMSVSAQAPVVAKAPENEAVSTSVAQKEDSSVQITSNEGEATSSVSPKPAMPRMAPPIRMAVQSNAILNVKPSDPTTAVQTPTSVSATPPKEPSKKESDIATLSNIDPDLDMMAFKHVALEGKVIDLVYSSDDVAVLCKLFSDDHTWTVDMTPNVGDCAWTNEDGDVQKPCAALMAQVEALKKMEADAEIIPAILMVRGFIQNFQEVSDYLLQNKITLVQYENEKLSGVTSLHELLKEKFSLFPADEDVADEEASEVSETEEEGDTNEEEQQTGQQNA